MFWSQFAGLYYASSAPPPPPPIDAAADLHLGEAIIDGELIGSDSVDNLGRIVARFTRGFRPYPRTRR